MENTVNNAFGFTLIGEDEFKQYEDQLKDQITQHTTIANQTKIKLDKILAIVNPFLSNLGSDPDKVFIKWKNRGQVIKQLQDQIAALTKE